MRRIKDLSRAGWISIGAVVAVLILVPAVATANNSTANASGASVPGLNGATLGAGSIAPGSMFVESGIIDSADSIASCEAFTPPAGKALVVTSVHATVDFVSQSFPVYLDLQTQAASCPSSGSTGGLNDTVGVTNEGLTSIPFSPGIAVANGHNFLVVDEEKMITYVTVVGYLVPASECKSPNTCN